MNFSYQPYDPPDYQRDQVLGNATLPESDVLAQDASDAFFGMEREAGAYIASKVASTPLAALRGPGQDEYIDAHTLNQDYGQTLGLSFSQPMRRAQADILVQQKRDQLQRDYTLSHAPGGFWNGTANLGTQLAVSAVDPANVAAAFVPVVGEARAGLWAQKVGSTTARIAEGAIEGGAGMAALQPVQYAYSNEFQQEYGPMDAFMNVAFGSVLGGGLHVGAGAISDMLGGLHPETREAALRGSVAQMAEGRPVDATAAIASDPSFEASAASPDALPETAAPEVAAPPEPLPDSAEPVQGQEPTGEPQAPADAAQAPTPAVEPHVAQEAQAIDQAVTQLSPDAQQRLDSLGYKPLDLGAEQEAAPGVQEAGSQQGLEPAGLGDGTGALPARASPESIPSADDALNRARTAQNDFTQNREPSTLVPPGVSEAAAADVASGKGDNIDEEIEQAQATLDQYRKNGVISDDEIAALNDAHAADAEAAKTQGEAAKAASTCLWLHP